MNPVKPIVDEVRDLQAEGDLRKKRDPELLRLWEFLQSMKDRGLVRKQEYDLPQVDTVGADPALKPLSNMRMHLTERREPLDISEK